MGLERFEKYRPKPNQKFLFRNHSFNTPSPLSIILVRLKLRETLGVCCRNDEGGSSYLDHASYLALRTTLKPNLYRQHGDCFAINIESIPKGCELLLGDGDNFETVVIAAPMSYAKQIIIPAVKMILEE